MILISQLHNEDRLGGTLANLMRGPLPPKILIYSAGTSPTRPAAITDAPVGTLLCTVTLDDPPGAVSANKLTLTLPNDAMVVADGTAHWARIVDGDGAASMDCDVSDMAGTGEIKLLTVSLLAGGAIRLISAEFG